VSDDLVARYADAVPDEGRSLPDEPQMEVVVVTGMSGGGKTAAAKLFEDLGYVVVDNLPGELLGDLADLLATHPVRYARTAIVLDVRAGDVPLAFGAMRGALEGRGIRPVIVFLEADDDVLIRRFSETRHRHPLADERGIAASIELERTMLDPIRQQADVVINTSELALRELRERLFARLGDVQRSNSIAIQLISFGFKHGVPLEADLVMDVRFMKNPHYIEALRPNSGLTAEVRDYVLSQPIAGAFLKALEEMLDLLVPAYVEEGKTRLTVAIGCTGGYHRSIVISEELAAWLRKRDFGTVAVFHRELER
jgi:RNase adapter protein RapZ